jgi:hypothetical protein
MPFSESLEVSGNVLSLCLSIIGSYYVSKAGLLNTGAENSLLPYGASFVL